MGRMVAWDAVVVDCTWKWGSAGGDLGRRVDVGGLQMLSDASMERTSTCSDRQSASEVGKFRGSFGLSHLGASSAGKIGPSHGASRRQSLFVPCCMSLERRRQQRLPRLGCNDVGLYWPFSGTWCSAS